MANYSCGHQPWMGVACVECRPDLANIKPSELSRRQFFSVTPDPTEAEYVAAAVALAEAHHVRRTVWDGQHLEHLTDCEVRFAAARAARGK